MQCNPKHVYSEVSPTALSGFYAKINGHRIAVVKHSPMHVHLDVNPCGGQMDFAFE